MLEKEGLTVEEFLIRDIDQGAIRGESPQYPVKMGI
jgi:hypothetical protein